MRIHSSCFQRRAPRSEEEEVQILAAAERAHSRSRTFDEGASFVLEVAALGQPFSLGMLYDARRGKLIPGVTLWNNKTLQKKPVEHNQHSSEFHINLTDSIEKKSALLDVNGSLKASFLGGLIEVEGSAKYLNDRKVILMPLKKLHPKTAYMISNGFISKAEDTLQELHNLDIRCNDLLEDRVMRSFPQIQEKLSRFKKLCQYFRSSLQETMAEKLPSIRAGEEDKQELVKVFYDRDKSPFSQERLTKWIKDEEREVTIIRYFVDMMEGTKIISDQSELDREVFKPGVEEVLCFVFTSLKSTDPYLQNMSDYLEKKKLEGTDGNNPPTQDQWYRSDEVIKQMTEKAEAVKNCSRLFITAIQNDQYKGGSIYLYRNTNLVTDDFSGPDVTDVEKVTNRGDLMCCKY
ncbi:stonustoxin subunit alpha-like [Haplochromis burtoni]|uniref:stonustoxin subunit alpha-like n=1 Tax=Haplochromis burtoni TaxID=8153 RepID=UPI001C2D3D4F|nr:stonustoxin subunit alpha-like [Haplochromis burtoni]